MADALTLQRIQRRASSSRVRAGVDGHSRALGGGGVEVIACTGIQVTIFDVRAAHCGLGLALGLALSWV